MDKKTMEGLLMLAVSQQCQAIPMCQLQDARDYVHLNMISKISGKFLDFFPQLFYDIT